MKGSLRPAQAVEVMKFTFDGHKRAEEQLPLFLEKVRKVVNRKEIRKPLS